MVNKDASEDMLGDTGDGRGGGDYPEETRSSSSGDDSQQRIGGREADKPPARVQSTSSSIRLSPTSLYCSVPLNRDVQSIIDIFPKTEVEKTKTSRKMPCLYCERTFVADNLRQKHVERSHSIKQARRSSSRFQQSTMVAAAVTCLFCNKYTLSENKLTDLFRHLVSAHPGKYFGCLDCQERFSAQGHLEEHNARFHGIKRQIKVQSNEEDENEEYAASDKKGNSAITEGSVVKTRHKATMKERDDENKKAPVRKGRALVLAQKKKESRHKKISVKSTKLGVKRSARLQTKVVMPPVKGGKKRPKAKERVLTEETKSSDKEKEANVTSSENPYPTFDAFYRVKKITDHSIDNLRITSLTFNDVFDQAFYNRIKCNIRENLLNHLDGKLFENEESESRISNFEKTHKTESKAKKSFASSTSNTNSSSTSENYGCEISLNAATPVPHSLLIASTAHTAMSQFGDDPESQIEYGSKAALASNGSGKKKFSLKQDEVHYKYFTRRKYQASILESKENRDLSKLDMWTQLLVKRRQQKIVKDSKTDREKSDYKKGEEYRTEKQKHELNSILDRRGPFEDLKEEASRKAAMEGGNLNQEAHSDVTFILEDILGAVFSKVDEDVEVKTELTDSEIPSYLNLGKTSTLPNDSHVDKSDKITLICSSQETENYEVIDISSKKDKNALVELSGEWARSRLYVCAACGLKTADMRSLIDHKNLIHRNVWCQHYEFVGNQGEFYKHLSIPGMGKMERIEKDITYSKTWKRSEARVCTKCTKQCNSLGELHRHVLECGEDWSWMLVRKKCKYKPFGTKTRKKRRGLFKRIIHKDKPPTEENREKKSYKKEGPRVKPSDADTIQRMLANLPPKRATRKIMCLKDGFPKVSSKKTDLKKNIQEAHNDTNAPSKKRNVHIRRNRVELLLQQESSNLMKKGKRRRIMKGRMTCNPVNNIRKSVRNLNKVISSAIIDNNSSLRVKRQLKNAVDAKKQKVNRKKQLDVNRQQQVKKDETEIDGVTIEKQQTEVRKSRRGQQLLTETSLPKPDSIKAEENEINKIKKVESRKTEVKKQLSENKKPIEMKNMEQQIQSNKQVNDKKLKPEKIKVQKVIKKKQVEEPLDMQNEENQASESIVEQTSVTEKLGSPVKKKVSAEKSEVIVNANVDTDNTKNNGKRKSRLDGIKKAVKKIRLVKNDLPKEDNEGDVSHFLENVASDTAADTVITPKEMLYINNQQPNNCDNSVEEAAAVACADPKQDETATAELKICVHVEEHIFCDSNVKDSTNVEVKANRDQQQDNSNKNVGFEITSENSTSVVTNDLCDKTEEMPAIASIGTKQVHLVIPKIKLHQPDACNNSIEEATTIPCNEAMLDKAASPSVVTKTKLCKRNKGLNACIAMLTNKLQQQKDDVATNVPVNLVKKRTPALPVLIIPRPICMEAIDITIKEEIVEELEAVSFDQEECDVYQIKTSNGNEVMDVPKVVDSEIIEEAREFNNEINSRSSEINNTDCTTNDLLYDNIICKTTQVSEDLTKIICKNPEASKEISLECNETNLKIIEETSNVLIMSKEDDTESESRKEMNAETLEMLDQNKPHPELVEYSHNIQKQSKSVSKLETPVDEKENIVLERTTEQKTPTSEKVDIIKCFEDMNSKENINERIKNCGSKHKQTKIGNKKKQRNINGNEIERKKKQNMDAKETNSNSTINLGENSDMNTNNIEQSSIPVRNIPAVKKTGHRHRILRKKRKRRVTKFKKRIVDLKRSNKDSKCSTIPLEKSENEISTQSSDLIPGKANYKSADDEITDIPVEAIKKLIKEPKLILDGGHFKIQSPIKQPPADGKNINKFCFPHSKESFTMINPTLVMKDFFNFRNEPKSLKKTDFFNFTDESELLLKSSPKKDLFSCNEVQPLTKPVIENLDAEDNKVNESPLKEKSPLKKDFFKVNPEAQCLLKAPIINNYCSKTKEIIDEKIGGSQKNAKLTFVTNSIMEESLMSDMSPDKLKGNLFKQKNKLSISEVQLKPQNVIFQIDYENIKSSQSDSNQLPDSKNEANLEVDQLRFTKNQYSTVENQFRVDMILKPQFEKPKNIVIEPNPMISFPSDNLKNKTCLNKTNSCVDQVKFISNTLEIMEKHPMTSECKPNVLEKKSGIVEKTVENKFLSDSEDELPLAAIVKTRNQQIANSVPTDQKPIEECENSDNLKNKKKGKTSKIDKYNERISPLEFTKKNKNNKLSKSDGSENELSDVEIFKNTSDEIEINKELSDGEKYISRNTDEVNLVKTKNLYKSKNIDNPNGQVITNEIPINDDDQISKDCKKIDNCQSGVFKKPEPIITKITISKIHIINDVEEREKKYKKKDKRSKRRTEEKIDVLEQKIVRLQNVEKLLKAKKKNSKKNKKKDMDLSKFDTETMSLILNLENAIREEISTEQSLTVITNEAVTEPKPEDKIDISININSGNTLNENQLAFLAQEKEPLEESSNITNKILESLEPSNLTRATEEAQQKINPSKNIKNENLASYCELDNILSPCINRNSTNSSITSICDKKSNVLLQIKQKQEKIKCKLQEPDDKININIHKNKDLPINNAYSGTSPTNEIKTQVLESFEISDQNCSDLSSTLPELTSDKMKNETNKKGNENDISPTTHTQNQYSESPNITSLESRNNVNLSVFLPRLEMLPEASEHILNTNLSLVSKVQISPVTIKQGLNESSNNSETESLQINDEVNISSASEFIEFVKPVETQKVSKKRGRKPKIKCFLTNADVSKINQPDKIERVAAEEKCSIEEDVTDKEVKTPRARKSTKAKELIIDRNDDMLTGGKKQNIKNNYNFHGDLEETNSQELYKNKDKSNIHDIINDPFLIEIVNGENNVDFTEDMNETSTEGEINNQCIKENVNEKNCESIENDNVTRTKIVEEIHFRKRGRKQKEKVINNEVVEHFETTITTRKCQEKDITNNHDIFTPRRARKQKSKKINYNEDDLFNFVDDDSQIADPENIAIVMLPKNQQKCKDHKLINKDNSAEEVIIPLKQSDQIFEIGDGHDLILKDNKIKDTAHSASRRGRKLKNDIEEKERLLEDLTQCNILRTRKQKCKKINYNDSINLSDDETLCFNDRHVNVRNVDLPALDLQKNDEERNNRIIEKDVLKSRQKNTMYRKNSDSSISQLHENLPKEAPDFDSESITESKIKNGDEEMINKINDVTQSILKNADTSIFEFNDDSEEETEEKSECLNKIVDNTEKVNIMKSNQNELGKVKEDKLSLNNGTIQEGSKQLRISEFNDEDIDEENQLLKIKHGDNDDEDDDDDDSPLIKIINKISPNKNKKMLIASPKIDNIPECIQTDISSLSHVIKKDNDIITDLQVESTIKKIDSAQEDIMKPTSNTYESVLNTIESNKLSDDDEDEDDENEVILEKNVEVDNVRDKSRNFEKFVQPLSKNKKKRKKSLKRTKKDARNVDTHCEICDKHFVRADSLIKHKRTFTHIAKLSEIEAREAEERKKQLYKTTEKEDEISVPSAVTEDAQIVKSDEGEEAEASVMMDKCSKEVDDDMNAPLVLRSTVDYIIEYEEDKKAKDQENKRGQDELIDISKDDDNIVEENIQAFPSFTLRTNNDSLQLADIISDVLNKPVTDEKEMPREAKPYKSLGARKSFDSDSLIFNPPATAAYIGNKLPTSSSTSSSSTGTFLETQISLLENIIENKGGNFSYIDDVSNKSDERCSSDMSLVSDDDDEGIKEEDTKIMSFSHNISNKVSSIMQQHSSEKSFLKPGGQYEEISDDTRNFEEQRARKALNRDEELFLECCSLLKSSSEISDYSKKSGKADGAISMNIYGLTSGNGNEETNWLQCEKQKSSYMNNTGDYLSDDDDDDNNDSHHNSTICDNYDDYSNSNTIRTEWNIRKDSDKNVSNKKVFEDISLDSLTDNNSENNSSFNNFGMTIQEVKQGVDGETVQNNPTTNYNNIPEDIEDDINTLEDSDKLKSPLYQPILMVPLPKSSDSSTSSRDSKKVMTKGAMKVFFEGLKVSIPTRELDMSRLLDVSPTLNKNETTAIVKELSLNSEDHENLIENKDNSTFENISKPSLNNQIKINVQENKLMAQEDEDCSEVQHNTKSNKVQNAKKCHKVHDIYDFEETQDNTDLFIPNNLKMFRSQLAEKKEDEKNKVDENEHDVEESDSNNQYIESFGVEAQSVSSFSTETESSLSMVMKKKKNSSVSACTAAKNITKKKCVIMGRIFKNAAFKAKIDDINNDVLTVVENKLVEKFMINCQEQPVVGVVPTKARNKMSEKEMDLLFDKLLEDETESKKSKKKKQEVEKKLKDAGKIEKQEEGGSTRGRPKGSKRKKKMKIEGELSEDEFNINKRVGKKRTKGRKGKNDNDGINLEQELKECMGVAGRKSQRKCTSGKQNILAEDWSSDDSEFEAMLRLSAMEAKTSAKQKGKDAITVDKPNAISSTLDPPLIKLSDIELPNLEEHIEKSVEELNEKPTEPLNKIKPVSEEFIKEIVKDVAESNQKPRRKSSNNNINGKKGKVKEKDKEERMMEIRVGKTLESTLASNRRKRAAADDRLYYWSSSSDDEDNTKNRIEVKSVRNGEMDEDEDDEDRPMQHGWIVGDSPKKLVTMLAQAKGKKVDAKCVKEQTKKRTTI